MFSDGESGSERSATIQSVWSAPGPGTNYCIARGCMSWLTTWPGAAGVDHAEIPVGATEKRRRAFPTPL